MVLLEFKVRTMSFCSCFSSHNHKGSSKKYTENNKKKKKNNGPSPSPPATREPSPRTQPHSSPLKGIADYAILLMSISILNFRGCAEHQRKGAGDITKNNKGTEREGGDNNIAAQTFTFRELAAATKNFRQEYLLGEGGFGRVYKGRLDKTDQVRTPFVIIYICIERERDWDCCDS